MEERKDGREKPSFREKTRFQIAILVSVELETNAEAIYDAVSFVFFRDCSRNCHGRLVFVLADVYVEVFRD